MCLGGDVGITVLPMIKDSLDELEPDDFRLRCAFGRMHRLKFEKC